MRFATNGFSLQLWFLIHYRTFMLSHQNVTSSISIYNTPITFSASFNPRIAPSNSSRGMLIDFKGATLALDRTRQDVLQIFTCIADKPLHHMLHWMHLKICEWIFLSLVRFSSSILKAELIIILSVCQTRL